MSFTANRIRQGAAGTGGGYEIDNSLRFNNNDSAYLSRTPSSAGNRRTWTFSCWVKRGKMAIEQHLFFGSPSTTAPYTDLRFESDDKIQFYDYTSGFNYRLVTTQVFRDPSAWYHVVAVLDTVNSSVKLYVNGTQITDFSTNTQPSLNFEGGVNTANGHSLGVQINSTGGQQFDGYLAEVNFIDGSALAPTDFGEFDATYGHWKPKKYTGSYSGNSFYLPFDNAGTKHTLTANGNTNHSTTQNKIGATSIYFDGTGDYLSIPDHDDWNFGTGDWTAETWVYATGINGSGFSGYINMRLSSDDYALVLGQNTTGAKVYLKSDDGTAIAAGSTVGTLSLNTWNHLVLTRDGSTIRSYLNGVASTTWSCTGKSFDYSGHGVYVGLGGHSLYYLAEGFLDEIRISNTCRYPSGTSFTPTTTAFADDSNTLFLIHSDTSNGSTTFADSSGVVGGPGNDQSGQANHWTPTSLAASDVMLDSPTNNFATLNPLGETLDATLSEGNTKYMNPGSTAWDAVLSTFGVSSGKWYWEVISVGSAPDNDIYGIADTTEFSGNQDQYVGQTSNSYGMYANPGATNLSYYNNGSATGVSSAPPWAIGDVLSIALDMDNGKIWWAKNGTFYNSGNPASGTGANVTGLSGEFSPAFSCYVSGHGFMLNAGQDATFAGNKSPTTTYSDGTYGEFFYQPPSGFKALCSLNISDPAVVPGEHFNAVTYTGNGSTTQSISDVGFQPDLVWTKSRSLGYDHQISDSVRGGSSTTTGKHLSTNLSASEPSNANGHVQSFDSGGFTARTGSSGGAPAAGTHENNVTYVAWNWKAGGTAVSNTSGTVTSSVSANAAAGFSIVSYTGDGNNASIGHGLNLPPEMVIVKQRSGGNEWIVGHQYIDSTPWNGTTDRLFLEFTDAAGSSGEWNSTAPTNTLFYVSGSGRVNASSGTYIAYCWHSVDGYSKIGSYTGNGNADGAFVYTGFRPAYVLIRYTSIGSWLIYDTDRNEYNLTDDFLLAETSGAEVSSANTNLDILSNGFKIRVTNDSINGSGATYIYMAFAEYPFKFSNAR